MLAFGRVAAMSTNRFASAASPLIKSSQLSQLWSQSEQNLVILETGASGEETARIPGSRKMDIYRGSTPTDAVPLGVPDPGKFGEHLRSLGVNAGDQIVLYESLAGRGGLYSTSRGWWTLKYFGHENVSILSGGFEKWLTDGLETETGENSADFSPGNWEAKLDPNWRKTFDEIEALLKSGEADAFTLLDVRSEEAHSADRIGKADNLFYKELLEETGELKSRDELRSLIDEAVRDKDKPIISYCVGGMTACISLVAIREAGFENPLSLYNGSWREYSKMRNK